MLNTDRAWFQRHPDTNSRLRKPVDGEVEYLAKKLKGDVAAALAMTGGKFPTPSADVQWWVLVVDAGHDTMLRLLTLRPVGAEASPDPQYSVYAFAHGNRVAVDNRRA